MKKDYKNFSFVFDKYEDAQIVDTYDLVMFNESSAYIDTGSIFKKANNIVSKNGYVQICDIFSIKNTPPIGINSSVQKYKRIAKNNGFELIERTDITKHILPTLQVGRDLYLKYVLPSVNVGRKYYDQEHPLKALLIKVILFLFLKDEIKALNGYFTLVFNPLVFKKHFTYEYLLFRKI